MGVIVAANWVNGLLQPGFTEAALTNTTTTFLRDDGEFAMPPVVMVQNTDGSITVTDVADVFTVSLNTAHANTWTANQTIDSSHTLTLAGISSGAVLFAGSGGLVSGDASHLVWDSVNNILSVVDTLVVGNSGQAIFRVSTVNPAIEFRPGVAGGTFGVFNWYSTGGAIAYQLMGNPTAGLFIAEASGFNPIFLQTEGVNQVRVFNSPQSVAIYASSTTCQGLVVQGVASQSATLAQLQGISSTSTVRPLADFDATFHVSTDASYQGDAIFRAYDHATSGSGGREIMRGRADGSAAAISFLGATPAEQQSGDPGTALVTFGLMSSANQARVQLTGNRTYYVRTDGNDSNTGLVNSAGGAFLTMQHAVDVASALDNNGFSVTIQCGDGTYTGAVVLKQYAGSGTMTLQGNTGTPANCIISVTSGTCIASSGVVSPWTIGGFKLKTTTSGDCLNVSKLAIVNVNQMVYDACAGNHIYSSQLGIVSIQSNYSITGSASQHWNCQGIGSITCEGFTITLTGTPAFGTFAVCTLSGLLRVDGNTFSGSATGTRYFGDGLGMIYTAGAGATYFPGNVGGSVSNGSVYE